MKAEPQIIIILTLNAEEATWLKNLMQNPIIPDTRKRKPTERDFDRRMREKIFESYNWPSELINHEIY